MESQEHHFHGFIHTQQAEQSVASANHISLIKELHYGAPQIAVSTPILSFVILHYPLNKLSHIFQVTSCLLKIITPKREVKILHIILNLLHNISFKTLNICPNNHNAISNLNSCICSITI